MKKLIILPLLLIFIEANAQSLNSNASYIRENFQNEYQNTIRKHAIDEWDGDHTMIVYVINKQADALFSVINDFRSENTSILYNAVKDWSYEGYERTNMNHWKDLDTISLENMLKFHCDWTMVKYVYEKQSQAKNAY